MGFFHIFLPVYNEQEAVAGLIEDLHLILAANRIPFHVLAVDDGSTDRTPQILETLKGKWPDTLTVLTHERNSGIDGVFRTGIFHVAENAAREDHLIVLEADDTNNLNSLLPMLEALQAGNDLVIASRFVPGGEFHGFPVQRWVPSWTVNRMLKHVFPVNGVTDYTIFFRGYSVHLVQEAIRVLGHRLIETTGFVANAEILIKLKPFRPTVREIPLVYMYDRKKSRSKLKISFTIRQYLKLMSSHLLRRNEEKSTSPGE